METIWENIGKGLVKAFNIVTHSIWVIGNFFLFSVLSIAWGSSNNDFIFIGMYIVAGNIVKFVLDIKSMVGSNYGRE